MAALIGAAAPPGPPGDARCGLRLAPAAGLGDRRQRPRRRRHVRAADGRPAAVPARPHPACGRRRHAWRAGQADGAAGAAGVLAALELAAAAGGGAHRRSSPTCPICRSAAACSATCGATSRRRAWRPAAAFNVLWLMERYTGPLPGARRGLRRRRGRSPDRPRHRRRLPQGPLGTDGDRRASAGCSSCSWSSPRPHYPWYFLALVPLLASTRRRPPGC